MPKGATSTGTRNTRASITGLPTCSGGARLVDTLREGIARGDYPEAHGREEEWLADRLDRLNTRPIATNNGCPTAAAS
jgi:hypothetical protein